MTAGSGQSPPVELGPPSDLQRHWWTAERVSKAPNPDTTTTAALRVHGQLDPERLERAAELLVRRHEALRTTFTTAGGRLRRVATDAPTAPVLNLERRSPHTARPHELPGSGSERLIAITDRQLFHLYLIIDEDGSTVIIRGHHAILDAYSLDLLFSELSQLYTDPSAPLPPAAPFSAWVQSERAVLDKDGGQHQQFWRQRLAEAPMAGSGIHADANLTVARRFFELPATQHEHLRRLARVARASLNLCLMTGRLRQIYRAALHRPAALLALVNQRGDPRWHYMVGCTINLYPLVVDARPGSGGPALSDVRTAWLDGYRRHIYPWHRISAATGARMRSFSTLYSHIWGGDAQTSFAGHRANIVRRTTQPTLGAPAAATQLFHLRVRETPARVVLRVTYDVSYYDNDSLDRWWYDYLDVLSALDQR